MLGLLARPATPPLNGLGLLTKGKPFLASLENSLASAMHAQLEDSGETQPFTRARHLIPW